MIIKMSENPWEAEGGFNVLYRKPVFDIPKGVTVLIGKNGAGKSTLLRGIRNYCDEKDIPCFSYDNFTEGSDKAKSAYGAIGDYESLFNTLFHSEGEQIFYNFSQKVKEIGGFCKKHRGAKEIVFCLDALDSGLDVEGILQLKNICDLIINDNKNSDVYIILTANNYGLIKGQRCLDVKTGEFLTFESYEYFEKFILERYKEERND